MPPPPKHSFEKRVHRVDGDDKGVKKVFVSLTIGPYIIKKRLEKNDRVTFTKTTSLYKGTG